MGLGERGIGRTGFVDFEEQLSGFRGTRSGFRGTSSGIRGTSSGIRGTICSLKPTGPGWTRKTEIVRGLISCSWCNVFHRLISMSF